MNAKNRKNELENQLEKYILDMRSDIDQRCIKFEKQFLDEKKITENQLDSSQEYLRWKRAYLKISAYDYGITYNICNVNMNKIRSVDSNALNDFNSLEEARSNLFESYCMYIHYENLIQILKEKFKIGLFFHSDWYLKGDHIKFIRFALEKDNKKFFMVACDDKLMLINHVIKSLIDQIKTKTADDTIIELNKTKISTEFSQVKELVFNFVFDQQKKENILISFEVDSSAFTNFTNLKVLLMKRERDYLSVEKNSFANLKKLERLELKFRINKIEKGMFNGLENLKLLKLSECNLNNIFGGSFSDLKQLKHLDLSKNFNLTLNPEIFEGLDGLAILEFRSCNIDSIHTDTFTHLKNLISLDLSSNSIKVINEGMFDCMQSLEKLNLSDCNIENIVAFDKLDKLAYLDLSDNVNLSNFSFDLLQPFAKCLISLNLNNCSLRQTHLNNQVFEWKKLRSLDLGSNNFDEINTTTTNVFREMCQLKELNLEKCKLKSISNDAFDHMNKLTQLCVGGNRLSDLDIFELYLKSKKPKLAIVKELI